MLKITLCTTLIEANIGQAKSASQEVVLTITGNRGFRKERGNQRKARIAQLRIQHQQQMNSYETECKCRQPIWHSACAEIKTPWKHILLAAEQQQASVCVDSVPNYKTIPISPAWIPDIKIK